MIMKNSWWNITTDEEFDAQIYRLARKLDKIDLHKKIECLTAELLNLYETAHSKGRNTERLNNILRK